MVLSLRKTSGDQSPGCWRTEAGRQLSRGDGWEQVDPESREARGWLAWLEHVRGECRCPGQAGEEHREH